MSVTLVITVDHLSQPARALSLLCRVIKAPHNEKYIQLMKGQHLRKSFTDVNPFKKIPVIQDGNLLILER
ncbi:hypothetical protein Pcinc_019203 [Petrolisthes cinctipes]|uniref:GST N-terminal domain-containing protein n=1 Tax=Petrolisthes cinctipes TaxID=88211 RepID=A0AAE1KLW5_PETCI|nr:hypothetical protein Pcinc_019203 [Petrolisthes cinctipes]